MKKVLFTLLMVAVAWCAGTAIASAQAPVSQPLAVSAQVGNRLTLTLTGGPVAFPDADPGSVPSILAPQTVTVVVGARVATGRNLALTCLATDLISGTDTIAITNVTWTSGGEAGFTGNGTMNTATAQAVGTWTGSGSRTGTQQYHLANNWNYAMGTYTATVTYTLTAL